VLKDSPVEVASELRNDLLRVLSHPAGGEMAEEVVEHAQELLSRLDL
jgi:hypothetical protein